MKISTHQSLKHKVSSGGHTHSETVNPTSYTHQHMHLQVKYFQQIRKVNSSNSSQTDKIPMHEHLYSDQYYHINTKIA